MFAEYETFLLKKSIPNETIPVGTRGVVLMVFDGPPRAYEVEFPDGRGGNLGEAMTFTLTEDFLDSGA